MKLIGKKVKKIKRNGKRVIITQGRKYYYIYYFLKRKKWMLINADRVSSLREALRFAKAWLRVR